MAAEILVLNASYEPHQITNFRKAMKLLVKGRAKIHRKNKSSQTFNTAKQSMDRPSVIILEQFVKYTHLPVAYSKANVIHRDRHICQYCGAHGANTVDHIFPQSKGGENSWENTVACCKKCNGDKGDMSLEEFEQLTGKTLKRMPRRPHRVLFMKKGRIPSEWEEFFYY